MEASLDTALAEAEALAAKIRTDTGPNTFVAAERVEIDFLATVEQVCNLLNQFVLADDRSRLVQVLGAPYVRLTRINKLLLTVALSEKRASDARWARLASFSKMAQDVLRDLDGKQFQEWQEANLQNKGDATLSNGDAVEVATIEENHTSEKDDHGVNQDKLGVDDNSVSGDSAYDEISQTDSEEREESLENQETVANIEPASDTHETVTVRAENETSSMPMKFIDYPCGSHALIVNGNVATRVADVQGTSHSSARLSKNMPDDGCTVMSESPLPKFNNIGQYAEIRVEEINSKYSTGSVGLGITRLEPNHWRLLGLKFPERLDNFPKSSWIFGGPYNGTTRRLYVNGTKFFKYTPKKKPGTEQLWAVGDCIGILVRNDGMLALYINREHVVTTQPPGLDSDLQSTDLWLVAEAFGFVTSISVVDVVDPTTLPIPSTSSSPQEGGTMECGSSEARGPLLSKEHTATKRTTFGLGFRSPTFFRGKTSGSVPSETKTEPEKTPKPKDAKPTGKSKSKFEADQVLF